MANLLKEHGDAKKAFLVPPRLGQTGPEIRKVRVWKKRKADVIRRMKTGFVDLGDNHHMAIYRDASGKIAFKVVSRFEVNRRIARREKIVQRQCEELTLIYSFSLGDTVEIPKGDYKGLWTVTSLKAEGKLVVVPINDVSQSPKKTNLGVVALFEEKGARKVSVDPIGRIRPAGD